MTVMATALTSFGAFMSVVTASMTAPFCEQLDRQTRPTATPIAAATRGFDIGSWATEGAASSQRPACVSG